MVSVTCILKSWNKTIIILHIQLVAYQHICINTLYKYLTWLSLQDENANSSGQRPQHIEWQQDGDLLNVLCLNKDQRRYLNGCIFAISIKVPNSIRVDVLKGTWTATLVK